MISIVDGAIKEPVVTCVNKLSAFYGHPIQIHLPHFFPENTLVLDPAPEAIFILGSASSVHDQLPWHSWLRDYISSASDRNIPIFGFCFGHQIIADVFGASVGFNDSSKEKKQGSRLIRFARDFGDIRKGAELRIGISHREKVMSCPAGFEVLASSDGQEFDALIHPEKRIVSFQPHVEGSHFFVKNTCRLLDKAQQHQVQIDSLEILEQIKKMIS